MEAKRNVRRLSEMVFDERGLSEVYSDGSVVFTPAAVPGRITFDTSVSAPANITGAGEGEILSILSQMRRCLAKKTADGSVVISYLDDNDSTKYEDGSVANLTGVEGDVMVVKPAFYYKHVAVSSTEFAYELSQSDDGTGWVESPASLLGAYKGVISSGVLYSRSGVRPTTEVSQSDFESAATSRGAGYGIIDFEQHCMLALLFYAKYGTRNSRSVLGVGTATQRVDNTTGSTNLIGIRDSDVSRKGYVNFQGIEGIFGGLSEWVSGVEVNDYVWTITNPDGSVRVVSGAPDIGGRIVEIAASQGPYFDVIPTAKGTDGKAYYTDYYLPTMGRGYTLYRSGAGTWDTNGVAYTYVHTPPTDPGMNTTSRLSFRGDIVEAGSAAAFKALPLL